MGRFPRSLLGLLTALACAGELAAQVRIPRALRNQRRPTSVRADSARTDSARTAAILAALPAPLAWVASDDFRDSLSVDYWRFLASRSCPQAGWIPELHGTPDQVHQAIGPLSAAFRRRIGFQLNDEGAGTPVSQTLVYDGPKYKIESVLIKHRMPGALVYGLLVTPTRRSAAEAPAVILIHGTGTLPRQAVGWRYPGAEPITYDAPPFFGMAIGLAEMGYVVFVPWIRDDVEQFWPFRPWMSLEGQGGIFRAKRAGSTLGLTLGQLQAGVDLLAKSGPGTDTTRIAAIGWEEGADLAAALGAIDPRVKAVVRLMPPVDRRRWRSTVGGAQANPGFMQFDCTFGEVELGAMLAPRPQLYDWTTRDPTFPRIRFYVDTAQVDSTRRYYRALREGGGIWLQHDTTSQVGRTTRVGRWLNQVFQRRDTVALPTGDVPPIPAVRDYVTAYRANVINTMNTAIADLGGCPAPLAPPPSVDDPDQFARGSFVWRNALGRQLRLTPPRQTPLRVKRRILIERTTRHKLEWVVLEGTQSGIPLSGFLATPVAGPGPWPVLVTFDGDFSPGEPFGLPPAGRTNYLKGYALDAVDGGTMVFAPSMPAWFSGAGGTILRGRDPDGPTIWTILMQQSRSAVDFVQQLRPEGADAGRITMQGISLAGMLALYSAALDPRITVLVYSNPVVSTDSLFRNQDGSALSAWWSDVCGSANGVQQYLVFPTWFIWENGIRDANGYEAFPQEAARRVQDIYLALGVREAFTLVRHSGGHEEAPSALAPLDPYQH